MTAHTPEAELRERLAAIEHERWADWQKWCHEVLRKSGELTEGADELLERWDRQIATQYDNLTDTEKQSDREQVDRYWPLLEAYIAACAKEAERAATEKAVLEIMSARTEGLFDDGDLFIKRAPIEQVCVDLIGFEAFKAIQESLPKTQSTGAGDDR
jgi:putative protein kinase ArgK-like GTPase of G3E family